MAYGGLRGAIAFSMVQMLDGDTVGPRSMFVTTTLVVIIFTVFIQVTFGLKDPTFLIFKLLVVILNLGIRIILSVIT